MMDRTTLVNIIWEPMERSMPPPTITNMSPTALIAAKETWRIIMMILLDVMKFGDRMENKTSRTSRITCGVYFLNTAPIREPRFDKAPVLLFIKHLLMCTRRKVENVILAELFLHYLACQLAFAQYDDPVRHPQQFLHIRGDHQDRVAIIGQF